MQKRRTIEAIQPNPKEQGMTLRVGCSELRCTVYSNNKEALKIRIGFWAHYTISIIKNFKNIGNYLGPYIRLLEERCSRVIL